ncbi:uncharacterized protein LOC135137579 [Zophobas morio]|uniref:uncharacterized protein LOC135137579 n=1 Tax=Zophobas morio TaxID=2755281 RepID=UPI003082E964
MPTNDGKGFMTTLIEQVFCSKKELNDIGNSVTSLKNKLNAEGTILQPLKDEFLTVLDYYLQQIRKLKKCRVSRSVSPEYINVENNIRDVKTKLKKMRLQESLLPDIRFDVRDISLKKQVFLGITNKIQNNEISVDDYKTLLQRAVPELVVTKNSQSPFHHDEQLHVARILLKLFLRTSLEKVENGELDEGNPDTTSTDLTNSQVSTENKHKPCTNGTDNLLQKEKVNLNSNARRMPTKNVNEILNIEETKISDILESHSTFVEKKLKLEELKQEIAKIDETNEAVTERKNKIIQNLSSFIIAEAAVYSRQKLKAIEDYQNYAQQFAFPKRIETYEVRASDINKMTSCKDCIPEDNTFFRERRTVIQKRIDETLNILKRRAEENENAILELEQLDNIEKQITDSNLNKKATFFIFNHYRQQIGEVEGFSPRSIGRKMEVLQRLHSLEKDFYKEHFKELLPLVTELTEKYETLTKQLHNLNLDEPFQQESTILKGQIDVEKIITTKSPPDNVHTLLKVFGDYFNQYLDTLKRINDYKTNIKWLKNTLENFPQSNITVQEKTLKELEDKVALFEANTAHACFLEILSNIKKDISIKKSSIKLNYIVNSELKLLKENAGSKHCTFTEKIVKIFSVKENIEDICGEIQEMSNQKKLAMEEIEHLLRDLDEPLAAFAFKKILSENVLNIEKFFSNLNFKHIANKESEEFVKEICSKAKTFEESIRCYFGTKDSIDYYIIHENLMRLLEELDQLECEDDGLLQETIKTMNYIKDLKKKLQANAL